MEKSDRQKQIERWTSECSARMFKRVQAKLVKSSKSGGHAEVVVHLVQYDKLKRSHPISVTRHVRLHDGLHWVGFNPDRAVVAQFEVAERIEAKAAENLASWDAKVNEAEMAILALKSVRADAKAAGMDDETTEKAYGKTRRVLGKKSREAMAGFGKACGLADEAKKAADKFRAEAPPIVEFVF